MATFIKTPTGKVRAQVRRAGKSTSRTFDTKREAQDWAAATERAAVQMAQAGIAALPADMSLDMAIEAYLRAVSIKHANQASLRAMARTIGAVALRDLNAGTLQRWIERRLAVDGVVGATVAHNLGLLSGMLKWLRFTKHLDVNPDLAKDARRSLAASRVSTTSQERDRYITDAEIERMRAAFAGQGNLRLPMADLMDFALATAMRLGEICRIEWADFSENGRTIVVRDRKDPKRKLGNHMRVPLSTKAVEVMMRQPRTGRVFPFTPNSVSAAWIAARGIAGVEGATFHDLRHRAITDLFARGLSIEQVSLISGHKSWGQLRRYVQTQPETLVDLLG